MSTAPGWTARLMSWRARMWLTLGRRRVALELFDRLVQHFPDHRHALASRAHLRAQGGDTGGALADYARLTALPSARAADFFNQGYVQQGCGLLADAEASFRRALALEPQMDRAWYGLGLVLKAQSRWDEAIAALEHNTRLQPMSPHGWVELALAHQRLGAGDKAAWIVQHLQGFEPRAAARLALELKRAETSA